MPNFLRPHCLLSSTAVTQADDRLSSLSLIAETLSTIPLPSSLELLSGLLETLSAVTQMSGSAEGEVTYAQQLLMNAIEAAASPVLVGRFHRVL
jgi:U3 small nucleolar RNA-associated protein 10